MGGFRLYTRSVVLVGSFDVLYFSMPISSSSVVFHIAYSLLGITLALDRQSPRALEQDTY